jgi:streptomycin 6-kinase
MKERYAYPFPKQLTVHVTAMLGDKGHAWLDTLPGLIDHLSEAWEVSVGEPFEAGEFNFVAGAVRHDGEAAVIKIAPPFSDNEYIGEAEFLSHRKGRGAVRLLERDHDRRAILIERAVPGKNLAELFTGNESLALEPAIEVLRGILGEPPADYQPKTLDQWFAGMRRAEGTEFSGEYAGKAVEIYERLSTQPGRTFYLHGDFHPGNVVNAERSPYLAIDPKGIVGHVAYDIAVFLNNFHWWQETKPDIRSRLDDTVGMFSDAFEIDPRELREWAFAQMVLGTWWNYDDMPQLYEPSTLAKADIWNV